MTEKVVKKTTKKPAKAAVVKEIKNPKPVKKVVKKVGNPPTSSVSSQVSTLIIIGIVAVFALSLSAFSIFLASEQEKSINDLQSSLDSVSSDVNDIYLSQLGAYIQSPDVEIEAPTASQDRWMGEKDSRYVWIIFADLQCPYCAKMDPVVQQLQEKNSDKLAVAFRHLPLDSHLGSEDLAIASECIAKENGDEYFWKFINSLFVGEISSDLSNLPDYVKKDEFNKCLESKETQDKVNKNSTEAMKLGVSSTPSSFIYDTKTKKVKKVTGYVKYEQAQSLFDDFVKRTK